MTVQAEFAATLVDEWVRSGVREAVLAPGSRSAPLAAALLSDGRLRLHVRLDERSAAYLALGIAIASRRPVLVVTTSGTAAAELHPAVLEADLAGVALLCVTADRPPELQRVGAPQTVTQEGIFGTAVRFACSPGVPEEAGRPHWRSLASRLVLEACSGPSGPGPVHANLAFREPLVTPAGELPSGRADGRPWHELAGDPGASAAAVEAFSRWVGTAKSGVVIAGSGAAGATGAGRPAVLALARTLGWPVLADPRAWPRLPGTEGDVLVAAADPVLRSPRAREALAPERVLRLGSPPASKVLTGWLAGLPSGTRHLLVDPFSRWQDPERLAEVVIQADPAVLAEAAITQLDRSGSSERGLAQRWATAEAAAQGALDEVLGKERMLSEPGLARALYAGLPNDSALFSSSSMPVRDLEWFTAPRLGAPELFANRGANGIDGVPSTALGVAVARASAGQGPTYALLGDLAFLHDLSALVWGRGEEVPAATLVVVDNSGGGIFSFLPYASGLEHSRFERAFGTPQRPVLGPLASAFGAKVQALRHPDELAEALTPSSGGLRIVLAESDRAHNVAVHERLVEAVTAAVEGGLASS